MPSPIEVLVSQLTDSPHVEANDLDGVHAFINELGGVVDHDHYNVRIQSAVLLLGNDITGQPVGHVVYDLQDDQFRFVPHSGEGD